MLNSIVTPNALAEFIANELNRPVAEPILAFAAQLAKMHDVMAILFYGSCLHQEVERLPDNLLDFYLLTDEGKVGDSALLQWAGTILPPNVFYKEMSMDMGKTVLRAKYAVMSLQAFQKRAQGKYRDSSIWARFCQPARLVWIKNTGFKDSIARSCADCCLTIMQLTLPVTPSPSSPASLWSSAFRLTYSAELRSENGDRAGHVVTRDQNYYETITPLALRQITELLSEKKAQKKWRTIRRINKWLNAARLIKAAFTFQGGLTYILWKIERHSGVKYQPSPWQLRHPLLAAPGLAWRLYKKGAFR